MPESPRTRFRRNRAVNVAAKDRGHLAGKEITPTPAPKVPLPGPQRVDLKRFDQRKVQEVIRDLYPAHTWAEQRGPAKGQYYLRCSCGKWSVNISSGRNREMQAKMAFKDHRHQLVVAELSRRWPFGKARRGGA